MNDKIQHIQIDLSVSILYALKRMDAIKRKLLIVTENGYYKSLLSIGDIQRSIINNVSMNDPISSILRPDVRVASADDNRESIKAFMRERRNEFMPIIDNSKNIVDVIFWEDLFVTKMRINKTIIDLPVIIMAGGKGSRLKPLTNILPKPLIPIGEQTIIEDIMDRFVSCGCHDFYLSVNYKAENIKHFFENLNKPEYNVSYFQEEKPLGTAGSLHLLKDKIHSTFFVSNCDIIIDEDYVTILEYHKKHKNEITIVAAINSISIPYGTLETSEGGLLKSISEKPEYTFKINTGMYILEPHIIDEIPKNEYYHITSLIDKLCLEKRNVGVFPINKGSWIDIGSWDEYYNHIKNSLQHE